MAGIDHKKQLAIFIVNTKGIIMNTAEKTFNFYYIFMRKVILQKVSIVSSSQLVGLRRRLL